MKRDKKLETEMSAAMVLNMAKNAVSDKKLAPVKRQARAMMTEKLFAERVIADEKAKRKLHKQIKTLQVALAKACDWALDSADVIADEGIVDPEDGEDEDFRATIAELRVLAKQPEAVRHTARRVAREEAARKEQAREEQRREEHRKQHAEESLAIAVAEGEPANSTTDVGETS